MQPVILAKSGASNILSHVFFLDKENGWLYYHRFQNHSLYFKEDMGGARSQGTLEQTSLRKINFPNLHWKHFPSLSDFIVYTLGQKKSRGNQGTVIKLVYPAPLRVLYQLLCSEGVWTLGAQLVFCSGRFWGPLGSDLLGTKSFVRCLPCKHRIWIWAQNSTSLLWNKLGIV